MSAQPMLMPDVEGLARQVDPLSRRGFFLTASAAAAAGYTLAAGPVRADAIQTDTAGLTVGDAKVKVSDGEMPVYYARPANVQNPPVILVAMEIFGLHEYIKDVTRRLGKLGAFAIAPDYYFRKGVDLTKITDIPQLMPIVNTKPDAELLSDLDATVAWAKSQGGDTNRLGIMGFCRGGRTVWETLYLLELYQGLSWDQPAENKRAGRTGPNPIAQREKTGPIDLSSDEVVLK